MNKNIKNALVVVGIAVSAILLLSWAKPKRETPASTPGITEDEKLELFISANSGRSGGAAPSPEVYERYERRRNEALARIAELGLEDEYRKYLSSLPAPDPNAPIPN